MTAELIPYQFTTMHLGVLVMQLTCSVKYNSTPLMVWLCVILHLVHTIIHVCMWLNIVSPVHLSLSKDIGKSLEQAI